VNLPKNKQIMGLVAWLVVCFMAAAIGAAATVQAGPFYTQLVRPEWAPPSSLFGPVWTILYALMGIAAWLVWRVGGFRAARASLGLFVAQLAINALWSWLFFAWHLGGLAFADIVLLWALVAATLVAFWRARPLAGVARSVPALGQFRFRTQPCRLATQSADSWVAEWLPDNSFQADDFAPA
jgi:tryptophan-rich sensory protein